MPSPVRAETTALSPTWLRRRAIVSGAARSALFSTMISGTSKPSSSLSTVRTAVICPSGSGWEASTTCSSRSESPTSSSVERNASTSWVGRWRTKPTVSAKVNSRPSGVLARRTVGSSVANRAFSTRTPAPVRRFSSEDFPALV